MLAHLFERYSSTVVLIVLQIPPAVLYVIITLLFPDLPWEIAYKSYLIAFVFVGSALWILDKSWHINANKFLLIYYLSTIARFLILIVLIAVSLSRIKFDQMFFTVNLIISYLYNSIIEFLLIHHRIRKDSSHNDQLS